MWLFILILITSVACSKKNDHSCQDLDTGSSEGGLLDSFQKFKTDVSKFFKINYDSIENRRRKIKKAFLHFIEAAFVSDAAPEKCQSESNVQLAIENDERTYGGHDNYMKNLVKEHGYRAESHMVVTTDGYFLTLYRILNRAENSSYINKQAVLLHHGLFGSSVDWILLGPKKALPYILLKSKYDVWLTNARGSKYSKEHYSTTVSDDEFWNFSWHEMGQFDLPAVIDYIKEKYEKDVNLHFIGHSMGSTALLVLLSIYPRYNHVLKSAVLLAPMVYMYKIKGPLRLLAEFYSENENFRKYESLNFLTSQKSGPLKTLPWDIVAKYCRGDKILCTNPLLLIANGGQDITNAKLREEIQTYSPAGVSVKTILHYIQLVKSGNFQMYDLGEKRNIKKYGTKTPPIYRLNDVTIPVVTFSSSDDWLATISDIQSLLPNLQNSVMHHVVRRNDFSHTDFVWAEDADVLVYYVIVDVLKDLKTRNEV